MKKDPLYKLLEKKESTGLLCHQSACYSYTGKDRFQSRARRRQLKKEWLQGKYETFIDKNAIEMLVGDRLLLDYLYDEANWQEIRIKSDERKRERIKEVSLFLIINHLYKN